MSASPELKQQEAVSQTQQLWEYFVVVGLPNTGIQTVHGEAGFLGTDQKYKPAFVDSLPHSNFDEACRLPPQLPTCCLPAGIDIVLYQDLHKADLTPHTFACVLTEGDGTKVYASCLTFYDPVPSDLCAKHEDLLGAVALKAMCLLSRSPYLASSQQVLCELYRCAFQQGSCIPVPDLIHSLLAVPCPAQGGSKLCLRLCSTQRVMCPPLPIGPPPGEVSLQPLLEVMQPDSLVGLFAAVLLEQRVLLRSRHHWLLTVVAEGVVRLLYPLKYQHVYIPVMPCSLTDYLEAPTPFLMGLHSAEPVDQRLLDMLVVADLDTGSLHLGKDDSLMRHCLNHPYMQRLERRVRMLMQPSVTEADVVSSSSSSSEQPEDPWVAAAQALGPSEPWSPTKQALLLRVFMEFFHEVLRDHQLFLSTSGIDAEGRASLARCDSRMTSGGGSSSGGSSGGAGPSGRALRGALSLSGAAGPSSSLQPGRSSSLAPGAGAMLQAQCKIGMQALLDHHFNICRHKDPALLQQVMQGLPFLCFVGENSNVQDPAAWLRAGDGVLAAWRAAEEGLGALQLAAAAAGTLPERHKEQQAAVGQLTVRAAGQQDGLPLPDSFTGTVVCIPDQPPSALMPPGGVLHKTFPPLILSEYSERSQGLKRRKTAASRQKRPSVGRRRAISELMGSPLEMRRKSPLPVGTNTDTSPPRLIRGNPLDMPSGCQGSVQPSLTPLAPGLPMPSLAKISNVSNSSTNASLSEEYSAEADLIGRQIGMLVHLMQVAAAAAARGCSTTSSGIHEPGLTAAAPGTAVSCSRDGSSGRAMAGGFGRPGSLGGVSAAAVLRRYSPNGSRSNRTRLAADVLEAARQLLSIQTGGNGWFIVSRLKELVANPPAPYTDADASSTAAAGDARPGSSNSRSSTGGAAATAAAAAAAAAAKQGNASGPSRSKSSSPQGKTMLAKSGKILGVNLSGGSSSSKSSGLAGLKVSHGVESFASAASAMASVISRNTSVTKQKHASTSNTNSPTNTADSSKVSSSAPSSSCGSTATGHGAAAFNHSASCRLEYKERTAACTISEGGSATAVTLGDAAVQPADVAAATAPNSSSSADGSVKPAPAVGAAADSADAAASGGSPASTGSSKADATQQGQQAAEGVTERPVPPEVFEVLADMVNSIVEVAAAQDDSRVVLTVLELACVITCTAGGCKRYLLSTLASNPAVRTEWFWASTFGFAVSCSYLNAEEFVNIKAVVTRCLQQFAGYLAGVGIPGAAAWVLLMQMGADHLQLAHAEPLEPEAQLAIRHHLTHAQEQYMVQPAAAAGGAAAAAGYGPSNIDGVTSSSSAPASADVEASQQCSSIQQQPEQKQEGKLEGKQDQKQEKLPAVPQHVAAGLKACGIMLPDPQAPLLICTPVDSTTSSSWQVADAPHAATPRGTVGASCKAAVTIPAPGAAEADLCSNGGASRASLCSGSVSAAAGAMTGDPESPVQRPMSPLSPAAATNPTGTTSPTPTPFAFHSRGGVNSPKAIATRAKEGYGSYAKLLNRQGTNSLGNSPTAAAAVAAVASAALAGMDSGSALGSGGGAAEAEGSGAEAAATPVAPALAVQGGCLVDQGALQWAAVHQKAVVALAASSYTAVSAGLDGYMKVLDLSGGTMRLAASMQIPSLQGASAEALSSPQVLPVLQLWHDGQRAAVGNARHQAVWIVDLTGGKPSLELSGLGSSVSCLFPLYRNRDALLSGLTHGSAGCMRGSMASGSTHLAAAYLWDLRRPKKPASSLNFPVEPLSAASPAPAAAAAADCAGTVEAASVTSSPLTSRAVAASCVGEVGPAAGVPGILCLSVHEDGALAAGGFKDGRVLTWDMRQPGTPLSECKGHTGPVNHVSFLPSAASAAAGLGRVPLLLTGSEDWTARLWDAETGSCRGACIGHGGAVTAMQTVHSSTATRFVTGASDGSLGVWGLDGEMVSLVQQHEEPVMLLRQGGDTLVSGAADKMCHVWALQHLLPGSNNGSSNGCSSLVQPSKLLASQKKAAAVGAMAFDPVAEMLCAGHKDGIVSVWNCCYSMQCGTIFE